MSWRWLVAVLAFGFLMGIVDLVILLKVGVLAGRLFIPVSLLLGVWFGSWAVRRWPS